jgi:cation diffusion facilitator family transporter
MSNDDIKRKTKQVLWFTAIGAVANVLLAGIKIFVGTVAHSQALVADGFHSFTDLLTDAAIIIGAKHWNAPPDRCHPYGHGRIETLITLFISGALASVGIGIAYEAIASLKGAQHEGPMSWYVLVVAVVSVVAKEILYRRTAACGQRIKSKALVANAWHHRSDAISSIPVALAVVCSNLFPAVRYIDPIAALLVAVMILRATVKIAWPNISELLEQRIEKELENRIVERAAAFSEIQEVHRIRCRRQGMTVLVDLHMLVESSMTVKEAHDIAEALKAFIIEREEGVLDVLIHIEPFIPTEREEGKDD